MHVALRATALGVVPSLAAVPAVAQPASAAGTDRIVAERVIGLAAP